MIKQGIILVATGHANYGKMAYNLALTIRAAGPASIALVYDEDGIKSLRPTERAVFDNLIALPDGYASGVRAKLHLDQLSPFDETIYFDADMLWISQQPVSALFEQFAADEFWMIAEGSTDAFNPAYYFWASEQEIMNRYKVEWVPQTRSEVIYWKKGTKVFEKARASKPERKLLSIREFAGQTPDELYFNIALAQLNIRPRALTPAYWPRLVNKGYPEIRDLRKDYYLLSFGSNFIPSVMQKQHDKFMTAICYRLGTPFLYKIQSKKNWAPGRQKM
jgi:hypothetical protein